MNFFTQLWTVRMSDWQRALTVACFSGPIGMIVENILVWVTPGSPWALTLDWHTLVKAFVGGGIGYMSKNFITGKKGNLLTNGGTAPIPDIPKVEVIK